MIQITDNQCPICMKENLVWNLNYDKTQMEMFKCGHGTCKACYKQLQQTNRSQSKSFSCPLCRGDEQQHTIAFFAKKTETWTTFAEWYGDYEFYIKNGLANNVVRNSTFGKQLLRLVRKNRRSSSVVNPVGKM